MAWGFRVKPLFCLHPRGRGIFLTIMAIPLFVTVYFLIFLDLDIINNNSHTRMPANKVPRDARVFLKSMVKMQQALDDLSYDLSRVIGHRDQIRVKVMMLMNRSLSNHDRENLLKDLQVTTKADYFQNFTSFMRHDFLITCNQIKAIREIGKPKWRDNYSYTEEGLYGLQPVVIVRSRTDINKCPFTTNPDIKTCRLYSNYLLMQEILLLQQLRHLGLVRLLGFCVQGLKSGVSYIAKTGQKLNFTEVLNMKWDSKIQFLWHLASLADYLQRSPLGTVSIRPFSADAILLAQPGRPVLWDVRHLVVGDPQCRMQANCFVNGTDTGIMCVHGHCEGLSSLLMMQEAYGTFFQPLLQGPPPSQALATTRLLGTLRNKKSQWHEILDLLIKMGAASPYEFVPRIAWQQERDPEQPKDKESIVWNTGQDTYVYKKIENADLPGHFDYACPRSQVSWGCVVTMPTEDSAFRRCSGDPQCRAFVIMANTSSMGWLTVCFKTGYSDTVDTPDSTIYIKVPLGGPEDDLKLGDWDHMDQEAEVAVETLRSCVTAAVHDQRPVRFAREKRLMELLNLDGLTEDQWRDSMATGIVTSADVDQSAHEGAGGTALIHMGASLVKAALFMARESSGHYHHAHLAFCHLDRLLGLYVTPPSKVRKISEDELSFVFERAPDFKNVFATLVVEKTLTGVLVAMPPDVAGDNPQHLNLPQLPNITSTLTQLTGVQRNQLEYIMLLWLTGTPRHLVDAHHIKGFLLHVDSSDAFQQGVDSLLPYFYHCQFPRHTIQLLTSLQEQSSPACTLANQVFYSLKQDGLEPKDLRLHFKETHQVSLLVNRAAEKLLTIVETCIERFGEDVVLYTEHW